MHPRMQDRRVVRMPRHSLDDQGHLISIETREQNSLQRVAIDTSAELELLFLSSRNAHQQLSIRHLHGDLRWAGYSVRFQIQLSRLRCHIDGGFRELITDSPNFDAVCARYQSFSREAVLALSVRHHPNGDGGARFLRAD